MDHKVISLRGSVHEAVGHGTAESSISVHHTPRCLEGGVQEAVSRGAVPQRVQPAVQVFYKLTAPVDNRRDLLKLCEEVGGEVKVEEGMCV